MNTTHSTWLSVRDLTFAGDPFLSAGCDSLEDSKRIPQPSGILRGIVRELGIVVFGGPLSDRDCYTEAERAGLYGGDRAVTGRSDIEVQRVPGAFAISRWAPFSRYEPAMTRN
jgi:hypothetical protein